MKSSKFNILYEDPGNEETVLFNSLYGSITIWDKSGINIAKELLENPNENVLDETSIFVMKNLIECKYIIDGDIDEIKIVEKRKIRSMIDKNYLDVIIMPNMTCNFACPYCFESHIPDSFMTDETEEAINRWLKDHIPKFKELQLNWFGGEPLLSFERIIAISKFAQEICNDNNVYFLNSITTNGYLLDLNRIEKLLEVGIFNYHITIDGPPDIHNKTRISKDGKDSFPKIFENILLLIRADKRIHISLRVNFNHYNFHSIPELIKFFPDEIRSRLSILFEPIFGKKSWSAIENISSENISTEMINYYRLARENGYNVPFGNIEIGKSIYCSSERENHFVFYYNGDIFNCNANFNSKERLGYLDSKGIIIINEKQREKWFGIDLFEQKCYSCKYLPLCMGGCRNSRISYGNTGSYCNLIHHYTMFTLKTGAYDIIV